MPIKKRKDAPRRTPESMESMLISLAMEVAERKLRDGTASSQIICHFLDLATTKEQLANDKLRSELEVNQAKLKQYEDAGNQAELYSSALEAMRQYSGQPSIDEDDIDE